MKGVYLCVIFICFVHLTAKAQDATVHQKVKQIEETMHKIDKMKHTETYRMQPKDTIYPAEGVTHPDVFGYWNKDLLVCLRVQYEDNAGKRWENTYYYTETDLISITTQFYHIVQFGGPNIYALGFKGSYFIANGSLLYKREEGSPTGTQLAETNLPNLAEWGAYYYQRMTAYRNDLKQESDVK